MLIYETGGTTPSVMGFGAATAIVMGAFDYTGGSLKGFKKDKEMDEFERKQFLRKNRRIPIEETISQLGEGRGMQYITKILSLKLTSKPPGIYAPGYDERRKQRIKENYGIDVPAKSTHS